jgi:hypothetical protein
MTRKANVNEGTFGANVQRVLMLTDIVTSPEAQMSMNYPEFGIFWPRLPNTSMSSNPKNLKMQPKVQAYFPMTVQPSGGQQAAVSP